MQPARISQRLYRMSQGQQSHSSAPAHSQNASGQWTSENLGKACAGCIITCTTLIFPSIQFMQRPGQLATNIVQHSMKRSKSTGLTGLKMQPNWISGQHTTI